MKKTADNEKYENDFLHNNCICKTEPAEVETSPVTTLMDTHIENELEMS